MGTASGDDDAAAVVQRLQPVEEVGVMAGAVDCGGQHCGFCGDHVRERLPQELRHLHWSVPWPPLLSALQGKPTSWAVFNHVKLHSFIGFSLFKFVGVCSFGLKFVFWDLLGACMWKFENFSCGFWGTDAVAVNTFFFPLCVFGEITMRRLG